MRNVSILLVEDNVVTQLMAGVCLRKWGMDVTIANHGKEALSLIQTRNFQLVLMDLQMPEMDGYESTTRIRAMEDPYFKNVPILAFSASSMIDSKEKAMEHGMTDYVNKPLLADDLMGKIDAYVVGKAKKNRLHFDIDEYAGGDIIFKRELVCLMISNIRELQEALLLSVKTQAPDIFVKKCHKVVPTTSILNDVELTSILTQLKQNKSDKLLSTFEEICERIIKSLEEHLVEESW